MSVRLMSTVWDRAPVKGADLLLLLAIADTANDDGYLWPAQTTLARKTRTARETVNRAVARFLRAGVLTRADLGPGREGWRLHVEHLDRLSEGVTTDHTPGDDLVTTDHRGCDDRSHGGVTTDHTEPSLEPSGNHSAPTERRGERAETFDQASDALDGVLAMATAEPDDSVLPGMPAPAGPEPGVQQVVAAYVEAYEAPRGHRPPSSVIGQVGRETKRLLLDGAVPLDKILDAARSAGAQGWRSIEQEANRLGAPPPTGRGRTITNRHQASAADRKEQAPW